MSDAYDLTHRADREAAAEAIAERARAFGVDVVIENWDGEPDVDITAPNIRANVWCMHHKLAPIPIISWFGASWPLVAVPGAWDDEHHRKATSIPKTWPELFSMLENGLMASLDGSAFDIGV